MYSPDDHYHQPFMEYHFWMSQLLLFNWLQQGLLSAKTNSKKVMMYLVNILNRPGKNRQNGKLLAGKFCELEGKNKEIHKGNPSTLEGNLPCWREILPRLQGNIFFSRPDLEQKLPLWISLASQPVLSFLLTAPLLPATVHHSLPLPSMVILLLTAQNDANCSSNKRHQPTRWTVCQHLARVCITAYLMRREIKASTSLLMAYSYWLPQLIPTAPLLQQ